MTGSVQSLTCPKCHGVMRTYERNGTIVDQCTECRGIFLDRGELERLIDAETKYYSQPDAPPSSGSYSTRESHHGKRSSGHAGDHGRDSRRTRGGFLSELFD